MDIGISYSDDIDYAIQVLQVACDKIAAEDYSIKEGPNVLGVQTLGSSDVVIRILDLNSFLYCKPIFKC